MPAGPSAPIIFFFLFLGFLNLFCDSLCAVFLEYLLFNHKITELLKLEKLSEITDSNLSLSTAKATTNRVPSATTTRDLEHFQGR